MKMTPEIFQKMCDKVTELNNLNRRKRNIVLKVRLKENNMDVCVPIAEGYLLKISYITENSHIKISCFNKNHFNADQEYPILNFDSKDENFYFGYSLENKVCLVIENSIGVFRFVESEVLNG